MYKLINSVISGELCGIEKTTEGVNPIYIPFDPMNSDYQEFLRWCEAGNEPLPPDSQE
jgi:hypothetical protein